MPARHEEERYEDYAHPEHIKSDQQVKDRWERTTPAQLLGLPGNPQMYSERDPVLYPEHEPDHPDYIPPAEAMAREADAAPERDDLDESGVLILNDLAERQAAEAGPIFINAIQTMPEPIRTVASLYYVNRVPKERIAEHMGLPKQTVSFLIDVALSQLDHLVTFHPVHQRPTWPPGPQV